MGEKTKREGERERERQFRLGKCGCRGAVEARNIQFTRYAFFALFRIIVAEWFAMAHLWRARGTNYRSNYRGGEGAPDETGEPSVFSFYIPPLLASFVSRSSIDRSTRLEFT